MQHDDGSEQSEGEEIACAVRGAKSHVNSAVDVLIEANIAAHWLISGQVGRCLLLLIYISWKVNHRSLFNQVVSLSSLVPDSPDFPQMEKDVLDFWEKIDAFHTQNKLSEGRP